jgi:hypothetical protein
MNQPTSETAPDSLDSLRAVSGDTLVSLIDELVKRYPGLPALYEAAQHRTHLLVAARALGLSEPELAD